MTLVPVTAVKTANKLYDIIKDTAAVYLPGFIGLYSVTSIALGWSYTEQVLAVLGGVNVYLGLIVKNLSKKYKSAVDDNQPPTPDEVGDPTI